MRRRKEKYGGWRSALAARNEVEGMKGHLDAEQLKSMDYKSLQALAKDMGVSAAGKAEDIIARIVAVEVDVPEENELTEEEKAAAEAARQEEERAAGGQTVEEAEDTAGEPQTGQETTEEGAAEETAKDAKKPQEEAEKAAGLVKVKAVTRFLDKQLNQIKDAGEAYSVSGERAAELVAAGVAEIVG